MTKTTKKLPALDPTKIHSDGFVYMLRTCNTDRTSHGGFVWPESGPVECPDFLPVAECGNGLHGLVDGLQDGALLNWSPDAKWLVWRALPQDVVDLDQKAKARRGEVLFCGDRLGATEFLMAIRPGAMHGCTSTSGYRGTSTSGDSGTSTSGYRGTSTSGDRGTSTSGDSGTSTSGYRGTSTSGDSGTSTSGYRGTSTSGYRGTSTSGDSGTSTSGYRGIIECRWYDYKADRYRVTIGYVGEDGIEANVAYRADEHGVLVKVVE